MKSGIVYYLLRAVVRFWINFFFKEVLVRNAEFVPRQGALLLALNHPNNLVDSLLIAAVMPREIHFLATAQLFRNPLVAALLRSAGVIPVYRQQDGGNEEKNRQTFARVTEVLKAGGVVAIYPEGVTHSDPFLHKIKTGAARMALQAEQEADCRLGLKIMPVGLNFLARKSFRRRVMVNFGPPLEARDYAQRFNSDERAAVAALTNDLQEALESQILNIERPDLEPLVHLLEEIYKDYIAERLLAEGRPERAEDFTLRRRMIDAVHFYHNYFPEKFERLREALLNYQRRRDYIDVPERAFKDEMREGFSSGLYWRLLAEGLLGLPVFLYGASQNLPSYLLPRLLSHYSARKETDYATIKFLAGIVAFPLFYGLQTALVGYLFGLGWAILYLLTLPLVGAYALRYQHGISYFRRQVHILHLFMNNRQMLEQLAREREIVIAQLNEAREVFLEANQIT